MTYLLPDPAMGDPMGPKLFPLIVGYGAVISGAVLVYREFKAKNKSKKEIISFELESNKGLYIKIALTITIGIIYGLILDPIGYVISTFVFVLSVMSIINNMKRMVENLIVSLSFSVVTYYVFSILLKLSLPRGLLKF
jgi:putative tricarboxylic transport membrane protein